MGGGGAAAALPPSSIAGDRSRHSSSHDQLLVRKWMDAHSRGPLHLGTEEWRDREGRRGDNS